MGNCMTVLRRKAKLTKPPVKEKPPPEPEVKLPHNWKVILKDADQAIDTSNKSKFLDQLCSGVFLNQYKQKYWVEKESNKNCFMLFARDLSISWSEDGRYWEWQKLREKGGVSIEVVELLNVCWLEVRGKLDTTKLSPETLYEVAFVIEMKNPAYGWSVPVNIKLTLPNGNKQEHEENLINKEKGKWMEIPVGEFETSPENNVGEMEILLYEYGDQWKKGLTIKGVVIRPKN